jgi:hypothetical protein
MQHIKLAIVSHRAGKLCDVHLVATAPFALLDHLVSQRE